MRMIMNIAPLILAFALIACSDDACTDDDTAEECVTEETTKDTDTEETHDPGDTGEETDPVDTGSDTGVDTDA